MLYNRKCISSNFRLTGLTVWPLCFISSRNRFAALSALLSAASSACRFATLLLFCTNNDHCLKAGKVYVTTS